MSNPGLFKYRRIPSKPSLDPTAIRGLHSSYPSATLAPEASNNSSHVSQEAKAWLQAIKATVHICPIRQYQKYPSQTNNKEHLCSHPAVDRALPAQHCC